MEDYRLLYEYDRIQETRKWMNEIPFIKFNPDWEIRMTPPYAGAVVRFVVKKDFAKVSVYLDCYGRLGAVDYPYWEIYPHFENCYRCPMNEIETLLKAIEESLNEQLTNNNYEQNQL